MFLIDRSWDGTKCDAYVFQVTQNPDHVASHVEFESTKLSYLGNRTALATLRDNGVNGNVIFVYITDFETPLSKLGEGHIPERLMKGKDSTSPKKIKVEGSPLQLLFETAFHRRDCDIRGVRELEVLQASLHFDTLKLNCV